MASTKKEDNMVQMLPPYRTYQAACRSKNYKASVMEGLDGSEWVTVTDKRTGKTNLLRIPNSLYQDLANIPEVFRMQFTSECVSDMIDNFM
jgi:hypothetical protein